MLTACETYFWDWLYIVHISDKSQQWDLAPFGANSIVLSWYFHDIPTKFWNSSNFEIKFQFQVKQKFWDMGKYMFRVLCEQHSKRISEIRSILCTILTRVSAICQHVSLKWHTFCTKTIDFRVEILQILVCSRFEPMFEWRYLSD